MVPYSSWEGLDVFRGDSLSFEEFLVKNNIRLFPHQYDLAERILHTEEIRRFFGRASGFTFTMNVLEKYIRSGDGFVSVSELIKELDDLNGR